MSNRILFALLLLLPGVCQASTVVQHKICYPDSGGCSFASNVTAGNTIIVGIGGLTGVYLNTPSDNLDSLTKATDSNGSGASGEGFSIYYVSNATGGAHTITVVAGNDHSIEILEVSGLLTSAALDVANPYVSIGTTNAPTTNSFSTGAKEFIFAIYCEESAANTGSAGTGYTFLDEAGGSYTAAEYQAGASSGSYTAPFVINSGSFSHWIIGVASFKEISSASSSVTSTLNGNMTIKGSMIFK